MPISTYTYEATLKDAYKINWRVEDLIGNNKSLDFSKPFLPDALVDAKAIQCLNNTEKLVLNQIRGSSYLHLFGLVEEFILPLVIDHVRRLGQEDIYAVQAFLCFAEEESKHIHLFRRFAEAFEVGFGTPCAKIGPAKAVADAVLKHSPLGVALMTLHIEWMTQQHYLDSVRNNQAEDLEPQFCSLLRHHWLEEAQHARLDTLMVEQLAASLDAQAIAAGVEDYIAIAHFLDAGLRSQAEYDLESLSQAVGRTFTAAEQQEILAAQIPSYRRAFLGVGMTHPNFIRTLGQISQTGQVRVAELSRQFLSH